MNQTFAWHPRDYLHVTRKLHYQNQDVVYCPISVQFLKLGYRNRIPSMRHIVIPNCKKLVPDDELSLGAQLSLQGSRQGFARHDGCAALDQITRALKLIKSTSQVKAFSS
jgi:hypothetical protein